MSSGRQRPPRAAAIRRGQMLLAPMPVQAADMALRDGTSEDWKLEFVLYLKLAGACTLQAHLRRAIRFFVSLTVPTAFSSYSSGAQTVDNFPNLLNAI